MTPFMNTLQTLFLQTTSFPSNNTYNSLNVTPSSLLSFPTPTGLIVTLSSLATPNFATSYVLHSTGNLRGSISYLYTTPSLKIAPSETNELRSCFEGYQIPSPLRSVGTRKDWEVWEKGERIDTRDVLLYGMMKIPEGVINGLYLRRMSPARLLKIMAVSEAGMRTDPVDGNGAGTANKPKANVLTSIVTDRGKYSYEGLYSTAGGLVGLRGLWNFGWDPNVEEVENQTGRLSIGGEVYYGIFNKSGGVSTGIRYSTLSSYPGPPQTMTLTVNPIIGHFTATYATKATPALSLAAQFDFNTYSYESDLLVGAELWKKPTRTEEDFSLTDFLGETIITDDGRGSLTATASHRDGEPYLGVLKARWRQSTGHFGILWESRLKSLLLSVGTTIDFRSPENKFRALGLEVQYNS